MRVTTSHIVPALALILVGASIFFTINVILFKKGLNVSSRGLVIKSGQAATVAKVIDGDEVSVKFGDAQIIIRILGIVSYDPGINDLRFRDAGRAALRYLKNNYLNKEITIHFDKFKQDSKGRLLAYIHHNDKDIGKEMVEQGLSLIFTRYPFSRLEAYAPSEAKAKKKKAGIWDDPHVASHSLQMKKLWKKQVEDQQKKEAQKDKDNVKNEVKEKKE
ncbi:MAG: thermonuclease family protein [bacterium]|nr:thermonuclease family protein [bacterium]